MSHVLLPCSFCNKEFYRYSKYVWENTKLGHRSFCSPQCLAQSRMKSKSVICENSTCKKSFAKQISRISTHNYCSRSCAVTVNNKKFPKIPGIKKICPICKSVFKSREKYCSTSCNITGKTIAPNVLIKQIQDFYKIHGRIPLKREFQSTTAARKRFGSWNSAIIAAGFKPNPVMFSKKYTAKDGHICDSLAEKIIDDWFYRNKIAHKRRINYPGNPTLTVDFVVGDYWIEFFGLHGQHRRYDALRKEKLSLVKKYNLKFIDLYPHHLFPKNKLAEVLLLYH
jgi:hypothetical protein